MKVLLDTHALLWWLSDDDRIGQHARHLIADSANEILVSVVSLWEIAVKVRVGKLVADVGEVVDVIETGGFVLLAILRPHLKMLGALPMHHRDPFDHLLIAQAIIEDAAFMTNDRHAERYGNRILPCSGTT